MFVYKHVWKSNTGHIAIFRALLLIIGRAQLFNFERHVYVYKDVLHDKYKTIIWYKWYSGISINLMNVTH